VELQDVTATPISSHDAAKESNLPSRGLPGPASFEDWMGHQARAAPRMMLRPAGRRAPLCVSGALTHSPLAYVPVSTQREL